MMSETNLVLLLVLAFCGSASANVHDSRGQYPIIGVISQYLHEPTYPESTHYIPASYVKFMEMFGARVVPIFPDQPEDYYEFLLERINAVVLPGGNNSPFEGQYMELARKAYNYSKKMKDEKNETFPIIATCLGLQQLSVFAAGGSNVLTNTDSHNLLTHLEFTDYGFNESRVWSKAPGWMKAVMQSKNLAPNFHNFSVTAETYEEHQSIRDEFEVIAYSHDRKGVKFIAMMESKRYPMLAMQYHPEKNLYEWHATTDYAHNFWGCSTGQYVGDYFVQLVRQNPQRFESEDVLDPYLIYHFFPTYTQYLFPDIGFTQLYLFEGVDSVWNDYQ